jgi:CRISPR-associated protein Cmr1
MRKQPGTPPAIAQRENNSIVRQVREYEIITPLFGGGVNLGESDPVTVIRGTEIRGQLRFWWRACRGGQFNGDLEAMKKAEDKIWGAAYKKGEESVSQSETVQIVVDVISPGTSKSPFERQNGRARSVQNVAPSYAAFPLQPSDEENQANSPLKTVRQNVSFRLMISFPTAQRTELEAALWAWETFGGVGARTRRGFGALRCINIQENQQSLPVELPVANQEQTKQWIQTNLKQHVVDGLWPGNIPHLAKQNSDNFKLVKSINSRNAMTIWREIIEKLKSFRQMRYSPTQQGANHPGRSKWPEPSTIRQLTGQSSPRHTNPIPNPLIKKFPRAAFGLPIIFQFKDGNKRFPNDPQSDPRKTTLQLEEFDRFASPLILKPIACQEGYFFGLAYILEGTGLENQQLVLKTLEGNTGSWAVNESFDANEILVLQDPSSTSQTSIDSRTDALRAFLKYL